MRLECLPELVDLLEKEIPGLDLLNLPWLIPPFTKCKENFK